MLTKVERGNHMENIARILDKLDNRKEALYEILQTLIRFRTPNPPGGNEKEAQQWIAARLRKLGFEVDIFEALPGRPNVVGKLAGAGGGKSVILNGHIDVCEDRLIDKWRHDPYDTYIEGGSLFGKGSSERCKRRSRTKSAGWRRQTSGCASTLRS